METKPKFLFQPLGLDARKSLASDFKTLAIISDSLSTILKQNTADVDNQTLLKYITPFYHGFGALTAFRDELLKLQKNVKA